MYIPYGVYIIYAHAWLLKTHHVYKSGRNRKCTIYNVPVARGPQLWIFIDVILASLDSWLDSDIPELILVIPIYRIRACAPHDSWCMENTKYPRINVEITMMIRDSRISAWFSDSSSNSKWFLEPSTWFGTVADPSTGSLTRFQISKYLATGFLSMLREYKVVGDPLIACACRLLFLQGIIACS